MICMNEIEIMARNHHLSAITYQPGEKKYILHIDAENKQYKLDFCPQLLSKYLETWKALWPITVKQKAIGTQRWSGMFWHTASRSPEYNTSTILRGKSCSSELDRK